MRMYQTMEFNKRMEEKYFKFNHAKMTIWEAFEALKGYVDASDPDTELPNLEHMLQAAEGARKEGLPDWMQLIGLLHDMGKIMFMWGEAADGQEGTADGIQWALGGDTWVLGCAIPDTGIVFPQFNHLNPDMKDPRYNTKLGIYTENCGFKNLKFAFGHDEYMYQFLVHNKSTLPEEALQIVRLHSCYAWHTGKNYRFLMDEDDHRIEPLVNKFNTFDLYTKSDERPNVEELRPYYQALIDKYCPGTLEW